MSYIEQSNEETGGEKNCITLSSEEQDNDGESNSSFNDVRRPMNAFLIFCKQHRKIVHEKYPHLENRSVTKILGEWWADLESEEKSVYTDLAKQYREAFMKANPDFKWYKLPTAPARSLVTRPSNQRQPKNDPESIDSVNSITPGKLADESQIGGLSSLFSPAFAQPHSERNEMSKPPKKRYLQNLQNKSVNNASHENTCSNDSILLNGVSQNSKFSLAVPDKSTSSACSALLKLAEMCSSSEYSQVNLNCDNSKNKKSKNKSEAISEVNLSNGHSIPSLNKSNCKSDGKVFKNNGLDNNPPPLYSSSDKMKSVSCDDEPLDLCTEKIKKIKTSHIIDHFVSKFLGDSLCADYDATISNKNSTQNHINGTSILNMTSSLQTRNNSNFQNHSTTSLKYSDRNSPIKNYSELNSSKYSRQSSVCSSLESTDLESFEGKDSLSDQFEYNERIDDAVSDCRVNKPKTFVSAESTSFEKNKQNKSGVDKNHNKTFSNKLMEKINSDESDENSKNMSNEKLPNFCGTSVISQLFAGFREAPNSKACDLFSKAIHSVIDNAYDTESDKSIKSVLKSQKDVLDSNLKAVVSKSPKCTEETASEETLKKVSNEITKSKISRNEDQNVAKTSQTTENNRRKSPRSCKGKRYQELMSIGAIHLPKERTNSNSGSSNCRKFPEIAEEASEKNSCQIDNPQVHELTDENKRSKNNSDKIKRNEVKKFDLDRQIAALPKCNLELFEKRWRKKHLSGDENSNSQDKKFSSNTDPIKDPDFKPSQAVIRRIRRHSESSNRISSSSWCHSPNKKRRFKTGEFDLDKKIAALSKCNMDYLERKSQKRRNASAPCGSTIESVDSRQELLQINDSKDASSKNESLSKEETVVTGSRKRKLRKKSITHLENNSNDGDSQLKRIGSSLVTLAEVALTGK